MISREPPLTPEATGLTPPRLAIRQSVAVPSRGSTPSLARLPGHAAPASSTVTPCRRTTILSTRGTDEVLNPMTKSLTRIPVVVMHGNGLANPGYDSRRATTAPDKRLPGVLRRDTPITAKHYATPRIGSTMPSISSEAPTPTNTAPTEGEHLTHWQYARFLTVLALSSTRPPSVPPRDTRQSAVIKHGNLPSTYCDAIEKVYE